LVFWLFEDNRPRSAVNCLFQKKNRAGENLFGGENKFRRKEKPVFFQQSIGQTDKTSVRAPVAAVPSLNVFFFVSLRLGG
jgi:hypothetical protein